VTVEQDKNNNVHNWYSDRLGRVNFLLLELGRVSHPWFGFGVGKFPLKITSFQFFHFRSKKYLRVGSKSTWVKDGAASYLLWVKSKLGLGWIGWWPIFINYRPSFEVCITLLKIIIRTLINFIKMKQNMIIRLSTVQYSDWSRFKILDSHLCIWKISTKNTKIFNFFSSGSKNLIMSGQKIPGSKPDWAHIYCGSKVCLGWAHLYILVIL